MFWIFPFLLSAFPLSAFFIYVVSVLRQRLGDYGVLGSPDIMKVNKMQEALQAELSPSKGLLLCDPKQNHGILHNFCCFRPL